MSDGKMSKGFVHLPNARYPDQEQVMEKIAASGKCPFCPGQFPILDQPIVFENDLWLLAPNMWPRENTRVHLIAVFRHHAETMEDLAAYEGAGDQLLEVMKWAEREYHVVGGLFFLRFGDMDHSSATVSHIHAQLVVPDKDKPDFEPVRFKVG